MVNIPRLHGHSSLQRELCYHVFHNDSSFGNCVFNTTYNINGGKICGGGFGGGVLGGIAMGLGAGIMGLLGGACSNFGFGGFFGGGGYWSNMYNNCCNFFGTSPLTAPVRNYFADMYGQYRHVSTDGAGGKDKSKPATRTSDTPKAKDCEDKDKETFNTLFKKVNELIDAGKPATGKTQQDVKDIYNQIIDAKNKCSGTHKDNNTSSYDNLLDTLSNNIFPLFNLELNAQGELSEIEDNKDGGGGAEPALLGQNTENEQLSVLGNEDEQSLHIPDNQEKETPVVQEVQAEERDLTKLNSINELTDEDLESDKLTSDIALKLLKNGHRVVLNAKGECISVKVPRNYKELVLAKKSGLNIRFCQNTALTHRDNASDTIEGVFVGDIAKVADKKYQFTVKDKHGTYTLTIDYNTSEQYPNGSISLNSGKNAAIDIGKKQYKLTQQRQNVIYALPHDQTDDYATRCAQDAAMYSIKSNKSK